MPLPTVPPTSLPPCNSLILAGFQILPPGGGVKALPYFQVPASNCPWFTAPGGASARALLSTPAGAASGNESCAGASVAPRSPMPAPAARVSCVRYFMACLPLPFRFAFAAERLHQEPRYRNCFSPLLLAPVGSG